MATFPESATRLLRGLDDDQRAAVMYEGGPLCVLAGPGSGKTRVITHRAARRVLDGSAEENRSLVVTFTRRAARELVQRLEVLGVGGIRAGTFHAIAWAELRRWYADREKRLPTLLGDPSPLVRELLGEPEIARALRRTERSERHSSGGLVADLVEELSWMWARMMTFECYEQAAAQLGRRPPIEAHQMALLASRFAAAKQQRGIVDLGDVLTQGAQVLEEDPSAAEAWRWRYRHLFVDEMQDVTPAQWRLLKAWLGPEPWDLTVVGDPDQAIYGWNGADPQLLTDLAKTVSSMTVLRLSANYRSTPQITSAADAVLGNGRVRAIAQLPEGPAPRLARWPDERTEAEAVVRWLREARRPEGSWSELAVLARTRARLDAVVGALQAARIPLRLTSARGALIDQTNPTAAAAPWRGDGPSGDPNASDLDSGPVQGSPTPDDGVEVLTFHSAKGLEWRAVAVVGLERHLVPGPTSRGRVDLDEERRLVYVALTRAKRQLWMSWVGDPSPFLAPVQEAVAELESAPNLSQARQRIAALRERLAATA